MKAKDTVMNREQRLKAHKDKDGYPFDPDKEFYTRLLSKQAQISFKAGIKEVVEWIGIYENELGFCEISNHLSYEAWQSKLKEWGCQE